jgi:hypothetical protein
MDKKLFTKKEIRKLWIDEFQATIDFNSFECIMEIVIEQIERKYKIIKKKGV